MRRHYFNSFAFYMSIQTKWRLVEAAKDLVANKIAVGAGSSPS
jgi:hypothetical protein